MVSFNRLTSILVLLMLTSIILISFLSSIDLISIKVFNKIFCYHQIVNGSAMFLHQKTFIDSCSIFVIFSSATHFGIGISNENKKSSIITFLSIVPIILTIISLKKDVQYRSVVIIFLLIGITVLEKLYEMASNFPKGFFTIRVIITSIISLMLLYFIIFL